MWFTATSATIANGATVVTINTGDDVSLIQESSGLIFEGLSPVEVKRAWIDGSNNKFIELESPWPYTARTNQPLVVYPTTAKFAEATAELRRVIDQFNKASKTQAEEGTDDDVFMTPLKTKQAVDYNLNAQAEWIAELQPFPWATRVVDYTARQRKTSANFVGSGIVTYGKTAPTSSPSEEIIGEGLYTMETTPNVIGWGRNYGDEIGVSKTAHPTLQVVGNEFELKAIGTSSAVNRAALKLPIAEMGLRTYDSSSKVLTTHATSALAFASETGTNKVIIEREDLICAEVFLRKITTNDPFVYQDGAIQSTATKMSTISTVPDNVRPQTYFAMNQDDTETRGRGVNWIDATDSVREILASDPNNKIFFNDKDNSFYQWCIRFIAFAGRGNGYWRKIDSEFYHDGGVTGVLSFDGSIAPYNMQIMPQGMRDENPTGGSANAGFYQANGARSWNYSPSKDVTGQRHGHTGCFIATSSGWGAALSDIAVNGQCYMYVIGTVTRLNQGLHHPSLNPLGTGKSRHRDGVSGSSHYWFGDSAYDFNSTADCFDIGGQPSKVWGYSSIANNQSGRLDDRFFDCIYSSGFGGFGRDLRYSAKGVSEKDFQEAYDKLRSGTFRGREILFKVQDIATAVAETNGSAGYITVPHTAALEDFLGTPADGVAGNRGNWSSNDSTELKIFDRTNGQSYYLSHYWSQISGKYMLGISLTGFDTQTALPTEWLSSVGAELILVKRVKTDISVSGEFLHTVVTGDVSEIKQCNDLSGGWLGDYTPLPLSTTTRISMPRPIISAPAKPRLYTANQGANWSHVTAAEDLVLSSFFSASANDGAGIEIFQYYTQARPVEYGTRKKRATHPDSLGNIWASSWGSTQRGSCFVESMIGKVPVGSNSYSRETETPLTKVIFDRAAGVFPSSNTLCEHLPITFEGTNSPAVKVLPYAAYEDNLTATMCFHFSELKNGTGSDWGDSGKVRIAEKLSTFTDENTSRVYTGTVSLSDVLGFLQNDK